MPTDYSKAKIYKLICSDDKFYIGSTVMTLAARFYQHKRAIDGTEFNSRLYRHVRSLGGSEHVKIELVSDALKVEDRDSLLKVEDAYIREGLRDRKMCLNRNRPRATEAEKWQREMAMKKMWKKINNDIARGVDPDKTMNERIREYYRHHKIIHSKPPAERKDPEELLDCECGILIERKKLVTHKRTKGHQKDLEQWTLHLEILRKGWEIET